MADTRINALSTATSSASDDFVPIDGTTNGTRKLSAYSPSFGGNATVGGTLTVSGSGTTAIGGMVKGAAATYSGNPPTGVSTAFQVDVENATTRDLFAFGDTTRCGLLRGSHDGSGRAEWRFGRYQSSAFAEYVRITGITAADAVLSVYGTTASTSTSSGALVVSGGVGVAGAIYAGAAITSNYSSASNTGFSVINTNSAGSPGLYLEGDAGEYAIIRRGGSTYANPRTLEYVATGSGAKHLFNTTAQFDGTVIAAASSNAFRITTAQTPASATATGTAGTIAWDTSYIYVCTATNTWKRAAISTW